MPDNASEYTALDVIFRWPIFSGTVAEDWPLRSPLFAAAREPDPNDMSDDTHFAPLPHKNDVEMPRLVRQFLDHVNIKNPVLDRQSLLHDTRMILETGLLWDSRSCLVVRVFHCCKFNNVPFLLTLFVARPQLISCALGAMAKPFETGAMANLDNEVREDWKRQRRKAEAFYKSAQQRFGFLDMGLRACQCHFLAGIYSMYIMRPVQAWRSFVQASTLYVLYLRTHDRTDTGQNMHGPNDPDLALKSLDERLFWSCLKSEWYVMLLLPGQFKSGDD